jgi:RHS repeat-associated protein
VASYAYDYLGRRVSRTIYGTPDVTIKYAYDGNRIIAEYDASGTLLRKFTYGPGIDEPICLVEVAENNAVYYYHFDGLGSVVALSDVNSVLVERYTYDVFGRPAIRDANGTEIAASAFANPYLFTGRAYDAETGLYYYRARYYDYATGRFLQADPTGYTDGLNLYAYVGNNPGGFVDPAGLCKEQSPLERAMLGLCGLGVATFRTISDSVSVDSLMHAALHSGNPVYLLFHPPQILPALQQFRADITSPDAERNGDAIGRLLGSAFVALAMAGAAEGLIEAAAAPSAGPAAEVAEGAPRPSPKFQTPTNPAQLPPGSIPEGYRLRVMPPTEQYPNGYFRLEKPMANGGWQGIDPSTMKPGTQAQTHVPLPPPEGQ